MYKNITQAPLHEPLFIAAITDSRLASMLSGSGLGEGDSIVIISREDKSQPENRTVEIETADKKVKLKIPFSKAKEILVRSCDICWNCGECMTDD